ncbi:glutaredoxin family protein [Pleionea sediminis]|uniref:glutaredoxin family protein n=1 Tax=Pleionea sediminis TaxID=2569479 RepID=UPI001185FCB4|nr:glutaredoxin family protein [Pleionea sediminis]
MVRFNLFSTDGCHLCEQAIGMFYYAKQHKLIADDIELGIVDIVSDKKLVDAYGERIPVLFSCQTQAELGWPFELDELVSWISSEK